MHDFLVIGGGVIGMTTARELAIHGYSVMLCDRGELGREASWAAGGILSSMRPWAEHPASAALSNRGRRDYAAFAEALKADTGVDPEYIKSGLFMAAADDISNTLAWARQHAIHYSQAAADIPAALVLHEGSILLPDIAQVRPSRLLRALASDLKNRGVVIQEHAAVTGLKLDKQRFRSVTIGAREHAAGAVIFCAGAWTGELLKQHDIYINTQPVCGQMLCLHQPGMAIQHIVLDGGHYLIPRSDDHCLVGSSMEYTGFRKETTAATRQVLLDWVYSKWPASRNAEVVHHWAGLRPGSEVGHPYIGHLPGLEGVYVNTAHFRKGVLQALPSARLLVESIHAGKPVTDIEQYLPVPETTE